MKDFGSSPNSAQDRDDMLRLAHKPGCYELLVDRSTISSLILPRTNRQDPKTEISYIAHMDETFTAAAKLRSLRDRAGLSRAKIAKGIGVPESTYQAYEDTYKKALQPVHLMRSLAPLLVGLGSPPITEPEVLALAGICSEASGDSAPSLESIEDLAAVMEYGVIVADPDPKPGGQIYDLGEAAVLKRWRSFSDAQKALFFKRMIEEEASSRRKSA